MRAVTMKESGVDITEVDVPKPEKSQVLVEVKACGLNRSDLLETQGQSFGHLGGETKILGGEFAGEVIEVGSAVNNLRVGDPVMCRGGSGWAEYAVAHSKRCATFSSCNISWEQASCLQGAVQTMHDALVTNARFKPGKKVLILGASSGAGIMGLQLARIFGAGLVIGTSGDATRRSRLREFGADIVLDSTEEGWTKKVLDATNAEGVDIWLLGIGPNGHIAFNEPGCARDSRTRVVQLANETITANSRFFDSPDEVPRFAITAVIDTIMAADRILLLACGSNKAKAVAEAVTGPTSPDCPASFLQEHLDCTFLLDDSAASLLEP